MRAVARKTLVGSPAEVLHFVEEGETVLITDQDRVIAELAPPRESRRHLQAVPRGAEEFITPPTIVAQGPPPRVPLAPLAEILRELDEDRADR